ncbi:MAG: helix-turn-helix transcriptional regulator [Clostridia bacterium]|jgi:transcriptional regulator with XRE-family HTH domain|nr:helix-turn-helix transcriptional regulator [Clostridia bacterium]
MEELYRLSKNLRDLRKQYGYTQKYVAEQLGIVYQSYQHYELGLSTPSLQHFIMLAKLYDVSYEDLLE